MKQFFDEISLTMLFPEFAVAPSSWCECQYGCTLGSTCVRALVFEFSSLVFEFVYSSIDFRVIFLHGMSERYE